MQMPKAKKTDTRIARMKEQMDRIREQLTESEMQNRVYRRLLREWVELSKRLNRKDLMREAIDLIKEHVASLRRATEVHSEIW